jgi:uncharacterized protein YegJ (DUF2314 family)
MRAVRAFLPIVLAASAALLPGCSSKKEAAKGAHVVAPPDAGPDAAVAEAALGPARDERATLTMGLYFTPAPKVDPKTALATTCAARAKAFERVDSAAALVAAKGLAMKPDRHPAGDEPPSVEALRFVGVGLSPAQIEAVQKSEPAVAIIFVAPAAERWHALRAAYELVDCLAEATDGLVFDASTYQLFARDAFRAHRLEGWKDGTSAPRPHINAHYYAEETGYLRGITLGMDRFALPDLVVNGFTRSDGPSATILVDLVAATLEHEGALVDGRFVDVDLDAPWLAGLVPADGLGAGATRKARFRIGVAAREDGDSDNRLWEIRFDGFPGAALQERQNAAFTQLFGAAADKVMAANHDDGALAAASAHARAQLPAVKNRFQAGLETGERLLVKAPFEVGGEEGGHEYMWIEIVSWKAGTLAGTLANEPDHIPKLHQGASVQVAEKDVYDWTLVHADGSTEGDETTRVLEQQEAEAKGK